MMSIAAWRTHAIAQLQNHSDSPTSDIDLLLEHVTQKSKAQLYANTEIALTTSQETRLQSLLDRRLQNEPIAYLTEQKSFWTVDLKVTPDTLIPRPETEYLVQWVLDRFSKNNVIKIADLGTGSGAIAIALATERPDWIIHATDQSHAALQIAKQNAKKYALNNIQFFQGDWFDALPNDDYDFIISNPPYIANNDSHLSQLTFEPTNALVSGHDGLDAIRLIIQQSKKYLKNTGFLVLEHGFDQQEKILAALTSHGFNANGHKDLSHHARFVTASRRIGILLINLGTPHAPNSSSVRQFLKEFLLDPYVITLPAFLRYLLVCGLILPTRTKQSTYAYQQIWTTDGSPLLIHSLNFQSLLQKKLGDSYCVTFGMRYGKPSIQEAIQILKQKHCEHVIIMPLFPQRADATTESAIQQAKLHILISSCHDSLAGELGVPVFRENDTKTGTPNFPLAFTSKKPEHRIKLKIIDQFYDQPFFINAYARIIQESLNQHHSEFILFSYHGLPKRHRDASTYQSQCHTTTTLIAKKLQLNEAQYKTSFQSRLGHATWIGPYTTEVIIDLRKQGISHLSVVCPSFVADCLETLEEINIRLRQQWKALGGESFQCIPCLNAQADWVDGVANHLSTISFT